jgi:hypothetical protein
VEAVKLAVQVDIVLMHHMFEALVESTLVVVAAVVLVVASLVVI